MGILKIRDLTLKLGHKTILKGLNIDFWGGHIHAIVGTNGAGKSTLASTIMGLSGYREFEGDILFKDKSIKGLAVHERARLGIALGWQEPARYEGLKIRDFLRAAAKKKDEATLVETMHRVGLAPGEYLNRAVDKTLSGGERKRIELASLLIMEPELIIMDEPDSGIDVGALEMIFKAIQELKKTGTTVILITHSQAVLSQAEHAFLLCNGEVIDKGSAARINLFFEGKCAACEHKNLPGEGEVTDEQ